MKKYINGNGFLTEAGKEVTQSLQTVLNQVISEFNPENETEMRTLGAVLSKMVGDTISNTIQAKRELKAKFDAMSDEAFEAYMREKYGDRWVLQPATPEELKRSMKCFKEKLEATMAEMRKMRIPYHHYNPKLR